MTGVARHSWRRHTWRRFVIWAERVDFERKAAFVVVLAAVVSGLATMIIWTGATGFGPGPNMVVFLLYLDIIFLLALAVIVIRRVARMWAERRRRMAGSGLHVRIVILFSLVAVTPAIIVAVFSALFLNFGLQAWFSERVRTAIEASSVVAQAYLEEHRQTILVDISAIANALNREAPTIMRDRRLFDQLLAQQANLHGLTEAIVVDSSNQVLARAPLSLSLALDVFPPEVLERAARGQIVVLADSGDDRVRAAMRLSRFVDAYLLVGRFIDPAVREPIGRTEAAAAQYRRLEESRGGILITFVMIFGIVAVLLLLAAVWIGITFASQISRPISALIGAAEQARSGDLSVRVAPDRGMNEIGTLGRAFNRMTDQLESQRAGLIRANRDLDERRRFTEAVLSGVSAGVIGLDAETRIYLPNRSACELLANNLETAIGHPLAEVVPEMQPLLDHVVAHGERQGQAEIHIVRDGQSITLNARIVAETTDARITGYVVTFDDITALIQAERKAAWADVARRIAHEIKNPLTPIQLASERLKRKYLKQITHDPETFAACTETIVRRVEDIGRMVDEFSAFARMPRPDLKPENMNAIVEQCVLLERNRHKEIQVDLTLPEEAIILVCDARQVTQALTNIIKNASEAVMRSEQDRPTGPGWIGVTLKTAADDRTTSDRVVIEVNDNGCGLPSENRDRLMEPYVTTRTKGTGLGLAIVKKIMEDHNGTVILSDREGGGACATLVFRRDVAILAAPPDPQAVSRGGEAVGPPGKRARG